MNTIPFNKPYVTGNELKYIQEAILRGKISGDGSFTEKCHRFFEEKYGFKKALLTTSCTNALEMAAILIDTQPGDEIIMPAYTFASTANAFALRGANIIFADCESKRPNIDADAIEALITSKTKAIVVVHYAGIACDMDRIKQIADKHSLYVIEDAAQSVDSYYKDRPLGSLGDLSAFSFHETKNIISGEGGMLIINDEDFIERAEIIREKGTNRSKFIRGEIDKYNWVDIGSSFLPSDMIAAFLYAQLESIETIQKKRKELWVVYYNGLKELENAGHISLPAIPVYATNNAHTFYLATNTGDEMKALLKHLKQAGIKAAFHFLSLHKSPFFTGKSNPQSLPNADHFTDCLLRLPLYFELTESDQKRVIDSVRKFYA